MTDQHPTGDYCFFCAPDEVMSRAVSAALAGKTYEGPTIHMQLPEQACPVMFSADTQESPRG